MYPVGTTHQQPVEQPRQKRSDQIMKTFFLTVRMPAPSAAAEL